MKHWKSPTRLQILYTIHLWLLQPTLEYTSLLRCDTVLLWEWLPLFWNIVVPSFSRVKQFFLSYLILKVKALQSCKIWHHLSRDSVTSQKTLLCCENPKSQNNIQLFAFYTVWWPFLLHLLPTSHATREPLSDGSIHVIKWHPVTKDPFNTRFWCWNGFLAITGAYECSTFYSSDISWIGYGQPAECGRNWNVFGNNIYSDMWCCKFKSVCLDTVIYTTCFNINQVRTIFCIYILYTWLHAQSLTGSS